MLQLPEVLKATEQMAREREAGQVSLFGGFAEPASPGRIELPETGEWPQAPKLAGARDTLGHHLNGHPLDPHRAPLGNGRATRGGRMCQLVEYSAIALP